MAVSALLRVSRLVLVQEEVFSLGQKRPGCGILMKMYCGSIMLGCRPCPPAVCRLLGGVSAGLASLWVALLTLKASIVFFPILRDRRYFMKTTNQTHRTKFIFITGGVLS